MPGYNQTADWSSDPDLKLHEYTRQDIEALLREPYNDATLETLRSIRDRMPNLDKFEVWADLAEAGIIPRLADERECSLSLTVLRELVQGVRATQGRKLPRLHDRYCGFAGMLEDLARLTTDDPDCALLLDLPIDQGVWFTRNGYAVLPQGRCPVWGDEFRGWLSAEFWRVFGRAPSVGSTDRALNILHHAIKAEAA